MSQELSRKERAEHLYRVISSERFLTKQGLGNEVPFFICPYPASEGLSIVGDRADLIERTGHSGVKVLDLSLYELSLGILEERGILNDVLSAEPDMEKSELRELLQGVLDVHEHLIPKIAAAIESQPHDVIFLSGARRRVLKQTAWRHVRQWSSMAGSSKCRRQRNWERCRTDRLSSR